MPRALCRAARLSMSVVISRLAAVSARSQAADVCGNPGSGGLETSAAMAGKNARAASHSGSASVLSASARVARRARRLGQGPLGRGDLPGEAADQLRDVALPCFRGGDLPPDRSQLAVQALELAGCLLQPALLGLEFLNPVDQRLPVDFGELVGLVEPAEQLPALDGVIPGLRVLVLLGSDQIDLVLDCGGPSQQGVDLPLVAPAEYVGAPVVDAGAVVLLVQIGRAS